MDTKDYVTQIENAINSITGKAYEEGIEDANKTHFMLGMVVTAQIIVELLENAANVHGETGHHILDNIILTINKEYELNE